MNTPQSPSAEFVNEGGATSPRMKQGLLERLLGRPERRTKVYGVVALGLFLLGMLAMGARVKAKGDRFNFAVSDGEGYFVYLPSLVVDRDLDFSNNVDVTDFSDNTIPNFNTKTELGYLRNKYPIGFSLSVSPAYGVAHVLTVVGHAVLPSRIAKPDGFGVIYQVLTAGMVALFGFWAMVLADRTVVRSMTIDGRAVGLAVLLFWVGSHYMYYYARHPFMVHVVSGFWVTCVVYLWMDIRERLREHELDWWQPLALCFCFTMAVVCRNTNVFILPLLIHLVWVTIREGMVEQLMRHFPLALLGLVPMALQMTVWHTMTGRWVTYSYGDEAFYWERPQLIRTLISSRHGLLSWAPLLILSFVGVALYLFGKQGRGKPLLWNLLVSFLLLWYVNSAWYAWSFGHAFGARAFLEISTLFIIGLAIYFDRVLRAGVFAKAATVGFVGLCFLVTYGLLAAYESKRIPRDDYLFEFERPAAQESQPVLVR
jgi:hypothetical protein